MSIFAVKIHYDRRKYIPTYLKYSQPPLSNEEYLEYLNQGEEGKGGKGFHECMNFKVDDFGCIQLYLPPGYFPSKKKNVGLHTIVWITYGRDPNLPWHIIGIHHNVRLVHNKDAYIPRKDSSFKFNGKPLIYHGETSEKCSTLFSQPMELDKTRHIPHLAGWGNGLRYLERKHLVAIISDRINALGNPHTEIETNELCILKNIGREFGLENKHSKKVCNIVRLPDRELGEWGEMFVYKAELEYARKHKISQTEIEWISRKFPQNEYDIKSIRKKGKLFETVYIEVKTTIDLRNPNINISSRQIDFANENQEKHYFAFVDASKKTIEYLKLDEIKIKYDLIPTKFRLKEKNYGITNDVADARMKLSITGSRSERS